MKPIHPSLCLARASGLVVIVLFLASAGFGWSQVSGVNADEFYRQGDAISNKVSNFMRSIFGSGAPKGQPYSERTTPPQQASQSYAPSAPMQQRQPSRSVASVQAPSSSVRQNASSAARSSNTTPKRRVNEPAGKAGVTSATKSISSSKPAPVVASTPPPKQRTETPKTSSSTPSRVKEDPPKGGFYTSAKKTSPIEESVPAPKTTTTTSTSSSASKSLTVVSAPANSEALSSKPATAAGSTTLDNYKPFSNKPESNPNDILPLPKLDDTSAKPAAKTETTKAAENKEKSGSVTASGAPSSQSFPTGTAAKKPGRVLSPYPPYTELDVRGLPSGSLALDPATQKVFKVP